MLLLPGQKVLKRMALIESLSLWTSKVALVSSLVLSLLTIAHFQCDGSGS